MLKEEFRNILIENGIYYVKVVRTPDGRGGYDPVIYFNYGAENYVLQDFEYVEYEGNINDAIDSYNKVFESMYDRGVRMVNYPSLAQLVEEKVYGYEQQLYTSQEAILQHHCARFARECSLLPKLPNVANHNIRHQPQEVVWQYVTT